MKIPQFQFSAVPRLEQESTAVIAAGARAKMYGPMSQLTKVATEFGNKVAQAEAEAEYQRLENGLRQESADLWNGLQERELFDENGAPTYDKLKADFDDGYKALSEKYTGQIKHYRNKADFGNSITDIGFAYGQDVDRVVRSRQVEYLDGQYSRNLNDLDLNDPNAEVKAADILESAQAGNVWTPARAENERVSFRSRKTDHDMTNDFNAARDPNDPAATLDFINGYEFPEWMDAGKQDDYRISWGAKANSDQSKLNAARNERKAGYKATNTEINDAAKEITTVASSGAVLSDEFFDQAEQIIKQSSELSATAMADGVELDRDAIGDLQDALRYHFEGQAVIHNMDSSYDDLVAQKQLLDATPVETAEEGLQAAAISKMLGNVITQIESDPDAAAVQQGLLKPREITLNDAIASGDLAAYLSESKARTGLVNARWGLAANILTDEETTILAKHLDTPQGIPMLGNVIETFGPESDDFLATVMGKGKPVLAVTGDLYRQADAQPAISALFEAKRMDDQGILTEYAIKDKDSLYETMVDALTDDGDVANPYEGDYTYISALSKTVNQVYAVMAADAGERDPDTINEDLFNKAFGMVVGPFVEVNGERVLSARRNMSGADMENWVRGIGAKDLLDVDTDLKDLDTLAGEIHDGTITLVTTGEQGVYLLQRQGFTVHHKDSTPANPIPFELRYK